ncbi:MAG: hypothetical protein ACRCYU_18160 [Nocardioides sp.]
MASNRPSPPWAHETSRARVPGRQQRRPTTILSGGIGADGSADQLTGHALATIGRIAVLVNAAGSVAPKPFADPAPC